MLKKGSLLLLAMLLLLTGCSGQAALVRDSLAASVEKPNYEFQGSLKLIADLEKLDKVDDTISAEEKAEIFAVLRTLVAGVSMTGSQTDLNHAKLTLTANDDKVLRDKGMWTGDQKASVDLLVDTDKVYFKSPIDTKYLAVDGSGGMADPAIDPKALKDFQEKLNKLTMDFMKKYIAKYGFTLSNVKNLGKETVKLPNGTSVEATHISIQLDLKELVKIFFFTANDATTNADVRSFAIDVVTLFSKFEQDTNKPEKPLTDAELRAEATTTVDMGLAFLKGWLEEVQKELTVDKIVEMAKEDGLLGVNMSFDYLVDANKLPVSQKVKATVTFKPVDEPTVKEPITMGFESDSLMWNYGKAPAIAYPKAEETVLMDQIFTDEKALAGFNEKGFMHALLKSMKEEHEAEMKYWEELESGDYTEEDTDTTTTPVAPATK